ncbi:hypothetical protein HYH02_015171 [Chlamydomonas schloesseri]|uniref:SAP domain-containing protein n=1 Tax=Chlamydomonas schloesseri TaxID=2026947 RepID=A0A835SFC2_9CHLO|nr:hypothetical protein HYH02_015171 [Chlamydomonas schloesseri]|eukprot:KAG2424501.1 hypothetical protein HYH02_015171 [Chlamydomonas schloesseri]
MDDGYSQDNSWDDEAEEDADDKFKPEALKEKLIFLIDAQEEMFKEIVVFGQPSTSFDMARLTVADLLRLKAWQHPDDQLAVVLYNTREKDKPTGAAEDGGGGGGGTSLVSFEGVWTLLDLQRPSAEAVKAVRDFSADRFAAEVGSLPGGGRRDSCLADALWRAQHCLGGSKSADKSLNTIVVFSNDPEPCGPASGPGFKAAVQQLRSRVEALQGYRAGLRLFPLAAAARPWAPRGGLWADLLRALPGPGEGEAEGEGGAVGDDLTMLRELAAEAEAASQAGAGPGGGGSAPPLMSGQQAVLNRLFDAFRRRLARKRTLMRLRWQLSDRAAISVRAYLLISDAAKAAKKMTPFNPTTNQPLKAVTSYVSVSDGALLDRPTAVATKVFELRTGNRARLPQVVAPSSEVADLAALVPNGLALLGFKPRSCLQLWHTTRAAYFLRPDERSGPGSTASFIALWRAMLSQDRIALCRLKRGASAPRHVALVAQDEQLSEYGMQTEAPGMYLIHLPFADDIRHPEAAVGLPNPTLDEAQEGAAAALIAALSLAGGGGDAGAAAEEEEVFDPSQVQNPWLQRHMTVVESLALSEPIPEWDPQRDDGTLPRRELWEGAAAAAAVQAFREAFPQQGTKRKPAAAARAAKAAEAADAYDAVDWAGLLRSGGIKKLKMDELKTYLRKHQLKLTGKKEELLDRVTSHLQKAEGG